MRWNSPVLSLANSGLLDFPTSWQIVDLCVDYFSRRVKDAHVDGEDPRRLISLREQIRVPIAVLSEGISDRAHKPVYTHDDKNQRWLEAGGQGVIQERLYEIL